MATLDELLALLPDNTTGAIDASHLRTIVTELWNRGVLLDARLTLVENEVAGGTRLFGLWEYVGHGIPPAGQMTSDVLDPLSMTWLRFHKTDDTGRDWQTLLLGASAIYVQERNNSDNWMSFTVSGATDEGLYLEFAVATAGESWAQDTTDCVVAFTVA